MGEIEDRLERLADASRRGSAAILDRDVDDLVARRRVTCRVPVVVAIAACLAVAFLIGGVLLLLGGDDPSSVQTPVGPPPAGADAGCVGKAYVTNSLDGTVSVINTGDR